MASEYVEGEWKNFEFKMLTMGNKDKVFEHLRNNFYRDETVSNYMGYSEDYAQDFELFYTSIIPENLSFFAEDKETKEIAGVRLTFIQTRATDFSKFDFKSKQMKAMMKVVGEVEGKSNFMKVLGIDEIVNFITASTDKRYRGQGLATEMYKRSINFLRQKGYKHCKSIFTSPWSRRAAKNLNFKELSRIYFTEFIDENGHQMFPNMQKDLYADFLYLEL